jgi:hypothetical protein
MHGFKIGAFGSNAQRFMGNEKEKAPGPGHYNDVNNTMVIEANRTAGAINHFETERPASQSVFFKS